jgi:hypothetical protein
LLRHLDVPLSSSEQLVEGDDLRLVEVPTIELEGLVLVRVDAARTTKLLEVADDEERAWAYEPGRFAGLGALLIGVGKSFADLASRPFDGLLRLGERRRRALKRAASIPIGTRCRLGGKSHGA